MKKILLFFALLVAALSMQAQSSRYPLAFGIGVNFPDYRGARSSFGDYFTDVYWEHKGPPLRGSFGINLIPSLNIEVSGNYAVGDNVVVNQEGELAVFDIDMNLQYRFANGYIMKESSWWDPYLLIGPEWSHFNNKSYFAVDAGFGMNFWFIRNLGAFGQAAYDVVASGPDYYHFAFGLKYRFNPEPDKDHDGVKDKDDRCPDVKGLEEFKGCPDTDGDGIPDPDDACPTVAGLTQFQGCPDTDGDGIIDKLDACPKEAGLKEFQGCPDRDGDGIPDKDDKCPDVKGLKEFQGCPDTDGDGIPDAEDKCPNEKGPASNNGCPVPPPPPPPPAPAFSDVIIYYNTGMYQVPAADKAKLDEVANYLKSHPEASFMVYGYTDNVGNDQFNMSLSDRRAKNVVTYLKGKGAPAAKLEEKAFGENNPAATNDTDEGKAKNRRVVVSLKK